MRSTYISGEVKSFQGHGRELGYPTANITAQTDLADGVYFGFADLAGYTNHPAVIFIGVPETVGDSRHRVEAHLLDIPDEDYYDRELSLDIRHFHRPNEKFENVHYLIDVMKTDEVAARAWFSENQVSLLEEG